MIRLPSEQMRAEMDRRWREYKQATGVALQIDDAELDLQWVDGEPHLRMAYQDGPTWLFAFDPLAAEQLKASGAVRH